MSFGILLEIEKKRVEDTIMLPGEKERCQNHRSKFAATYVAS
jgi:hypothetical protein